MRVKINNELRNDLLLKELGNRIASRRIGMRLKQSEFAARAGISRSAFQKIEQGAESTKLLSLIAVLRELGCLAGFEQMLPVEELTPRQLAAMKPVKVVKRVRTRKKVAAKRFWGNGKAMGKDGD